MSRENKKIREEIDDVIEALEAEGIKHNDDYTGLGDIVESALNRVGITEERFKQFFGLKECSCTKRKKWLNSVLYWHNKSKNSID